MIDGRSRVLKNFPVNEGTSRLEQCVVKERNIGLLLTE